MSDVDLSVTQEIPLTLEALVQRVNKLCTVVEELVALVQHDINATDSDDDVDMSDDDAPTWPSYAGYAKRTASTKRTPRGSAHSKTLIRICS